MRDFEAYISNQDEDSAVLHGTSGRLHRLAAKSALASNLQPHCTGLRSLTLERAPKDLPVALKEVGKTLESIKISKPKEKSIPALQRMRGLCHLTDISIAVTDLAKTVYAGLFVVVWPPAAACGAEAVSCISMGDCRCRFLQRPPSYLS